MVPGFRSLPLQHRRYITPLSGLALYAVLGLTALPIVFNGAGSAATAHPSDTARLEARLRALEDKEEILNLLAAMPFSSDVPSTAYQEKIYTVNATMDVGMAQKDAHGREAVVDTVRVPDHLAAVETGMAHFSGLPHIRVDGDRAVATGYFEILAPNPDGPKVKLGSYPPASGLIVWRLTASRWELRRTAQGWRVTKRVIRAAPAAAARDLLRRAIETDD